MAGLIKGLIRKLIRDFICSVRFTGVLFVQDEKDDNDVVGFIFGYQVLENE